MAETLTLKPSALSQLSVAANAGRSPADIYTAAPTNQQVALTEPPKGGADQIPTEDRLDLDAGLKAARDVDAGNGGVTPPKNRIEIPKVPAAATPKALDADEFIPKSAEGKKHWDKIKAEKDTYRAEVDRLKAELEAKGDADELRKQLETYQRELRDVAIERDPAFKQRFEPRKEAAIKQASIAAGDVSAQLEKLLRAPSSELRDQQISKLIEDLPAGAQRRINATLGLIEQIDVEREAEIAASRETYDSRLKETTAQQRVAAERQKQEVSKTFKSVVEAWSDEKDGFPFMRKIEGNDAHNAEVQARISHAENILTGKATLPELAHAAMWAANGEVIIKELQRYHAENEQMRDTLDRIRGATPGIGNGGGSGGGASPEPGSAEYTGGFQSALARAQQADRSGAR